MSDWTSYRGVTVERIFPSGMHRIYVMPNPIITDGDPRELIDDIRAGQYDGEHFVPDTDEYPDDPAARDAADFLANRPYYDREHVEEIARLRTDDGTPYCKECHDWHFPAEDHSTVG